LTTAGADGGEGDEPGAQWSCPQRGSGPRRLFTRGERKLVESGKEERVLQLRHDFQMAMRDDLVKVVEATLERKVIAFMSQNHIDPDLAVEVFVLESTPRADTSSE
jgi:uncharacterized protein YbcI